MQMPFYEVEGNELKLITAWSNNDAQFRSEYMTPLFKHLGVTVKPIPKKYKAKAREILLKRWGFNEETE